MRSNQDFPLQRGNESEPRLILLVANSDGALFKFRQSLIQKLVAKGDRVVTVSGVTELTDSGGCEVRSRYSEKLLGLGVEQHISVDFSGSSISPIGYIKLIYRLGKIFRRLSPDVIHCFTHKACLASGLALLPTRRRFKLIFTITGLGRAFSRGEIKYALVKYALLMQYRLISRYCHHIFFQNPDDQKLFIENGLTDVPADVVGGSGVDLEEFQPRRLNYAKLQAPIKVLCLSRGMVEKGFFEFYKVAFRFATDQPGRFEFIHAGNIDQSVSQALGRETIQKFAERHRVKYLGFVTNIKELIDNSSVIVHQSYYREGVPRSLIEALAMDKFIITCDTVGNREVVVNGENGFFCDPASDDSLFSVMNLITKTELESRKGKSRALAIAKFDVDQIDQAVIRSYSDV